ncbi:MAG: hypothetical protein GX131_06735 [candidate division WS1 bacterium]|jgi:uncharacterized membrane protein|nr:hypothetical protein [candidate division WS1 bacterium]
MQRIIYASFADAAHAEKAAGALLDFEMNEEDLSVVRADIDEDQWRSYEEGEEVEDSAKGGISTTTGADAGAGAAKGAGWGALAGILAGLATLWIPGVGLVIGGGALATALGAAAGATAAGAIAGGVTGYLKDQGVAPERIKEFEDHLSSGGAVLEIRVPSGEVDLAKAQEILAKYEANQAVVEA